MLPESITDIGRGAFGGVRFNFYEDILIYCKTVRIKGGSEFARIKALVIKSEYPESIIASY